MKCLMGMRLVTLRMRLKALANGLGLSKGLSPIPTAVSPGVHCRLLVARSRVCVCPGTAPSLLPAECAVAKPNYSFEKRQRELAKNKKKEEKNQRKLAKSSASGEMPAESPSDASAPADAGDAAENT